MATKAGVWIDHKQAIVVLVTDAGQEIKKIALDIGQLVQSAGGARNEFVAEDKLERKVENHCKDYYDDVIAAIRGTDSLLILGPGEAKGEFSKHIKAKKLRGLTVEVETTDKMTDRQLAAKVGAHFAPASASKTVALKKTVKKKAVSVTAGKRPKKAKK